MGWRHAARSDGLRRRVPKNRQRVKSNCLLESDWSAPNDGHYVFAGPCATVTTTATQRFTGAASLVLGTAPSTTTAARTGLCYQPGPSGLINNVAGFDFIDATVGTLHIHSASATVALVAGAWNVGACVRNVGAVALSNNDWVNGWIMVTN